METKPSYKSKTLWVNFITALCALFFPAASEFMSQHPDKVMLGFSILNIILHFITKDKVELT